MTRVPSGTAGRFSFVTRSSWIHQRGADHVPEVSDVRHAGLRTHDPIHGGLVPLSEVRSPVQVAVTVCYSFVAK